MLESIELDVAPKALSPRREIAIEILRLTVFYCVPGILTAAVLRDYISEDYRGSVPLAVMSLIAVSLYLRRERLNNGVIAKATAALWIVAFWSVLARRGLFSAAPYILAPAMVFGTLLMPYKVSRWMCGIILLPVFVLFALVGLRIYNPSPDTRHLYEGSTAFWAVSITAMTILSFVLQRIVLLTTKILNRERKKSSLAVYKSMSAVASLRDQETGKHLARCSAYAEILAKQDGAGPYARVDPAVMQRLCLAIPLHDIGKVGVRDAILLKPGKLTDEEFKEMQAHTTLGRDLIRKFAIENALVGDAVLNLAEKIAQSHHENWDGSGYPEGLAGEQIPYEARLMAIIDVYDALRARRVYKAPRTHEEAMEEMRLVADKKFDPRLFSVFCTNEDKFSKVFLEKAPANLV